MIPGGLVFQRRSPHRNHVSPDLLIALASVTSAANRGLPCDTWSAAILTALRIAFCQASTTLRDSCSSEAAKCSLTIETR